MATVRHQTDGAGMGLRNGEATVRPRVEEVDMGHRQEATEDRECGEEGRHRQDTKTGPGRMTGEDRLPLDTQDPMADSRLPGQCRLPDT